MKQTTFGFASVPEDDVLPFGLPLELKITDEELIRELQNHEEGRPRDEYALCALKIGLLALKHARGQLDGDTIKREGEKLLTTLESKLTVHARGLDAQLTGALKDYFDPESGRFHERVQRLVQKDGELESVLGRLIGQKDSELCKTLAVHFGAESPLMKMLSPKESEGLLRTLSETLHTALSDQRNRVLSEFSLDNNDGALCRLVKTLTEKHGDLSKDLQLKINDVVKEFSLDNDNSALSRMSKHLHSTSEAINNHLTLDKETSALFRLKREMFELLGNYTTKNQKFQEEVIRALGEMKVRQEITQRTPLHGKQFEQAVHDFIQNECRRSGDIVTFAGDTVGQIKNCKIGDTVIEIGPEHVAAGAAIVIESKDKGNYTLQKAREEMEQARKNRKACVGIFVYAKASAPEGMELFQRLGDDLFIVWDAEDSQFDLYLKAGVMVATALCTRQAKQQEDCAADFEGIEKAILDIEKKTKDLDLIRTSAQTINSSAEKILDRVRLSQEGIDRQVTALRDLIGDLKATVTDRQTSH